MRKIDLMTMSEILAEAKKFGFSLSPWIGKYCNWNNGPEIGAIEHLKRMSPGLFEIVEED